MFSFKIETLQNANYQVGSVSEYVIFFNAYTKQILLKYFWWNPQFLLLIRISIIALKKPSWLKITIFWKKSKLNKLVKQIHKFDKNVFSEKLTKEKTTQIVEYKLDSGWIRININLFY